MKTVRLGRTGLKVSRICLGCMTYGVPERGAHPWTLRRGGQPAADPPGGRAGHQLLRHRQHLFGRHARKRSSAARCATSRAATRSSSPPRCASANAARAQRRRPVAQGASCSEIDASLHAPRHGLRRPVSDPPLGRGHADRGDDGGAARRGQGGQGALHRRVVDVRVAVRQGAARGASATAGRLSSACSRS